MSKFTTMLGLAATAMTTVAAAATDEVKNNSTSALNAFLESGKQLAYQNPLVAGGLAIGAGLGFSYALYTTRCCAKKQVETKNDKVNNDNNSTSKPKVD